MKVLLTGATGFIATRIAPLLLSKGHDVFAVGRDPALLAGLGPVEPIEVDLAEPDFQRRLPGAIDMVLHLAQAGSAEEEALLAVNVESTRILLDHAVRAGASAFVLASSGSVYGGGEGPLAEDAPLRGRDSYARSKIAAEEVVASHRGGLRTACLRLFAPYGPGQRGRLVPRLVELVRDRRPVLLRNGARPRLNPLYVDHVADIFVQAAEGGSPPVVNVAGDKVLSIRDMAEAIGRAMGVAPVFEEVSDRETRDMVADTTLLRKSFRLPARPTSFEDGIRLIVAAESLGTEVS